MSSWTVWCEIPDSHITLKVGMITAADESTAEEMAHDHVKEILPNVEVTTIEVEEW